MPTLMKDSPAHSRGPSQPPFRPASRLLRLAPLLLGLGAGCAGDDGEASGTDTETATSSGGEGGETSTGGDAASFFRYTVDSTIKGTIVVDSPCSLPLIPIPGKPSFHGEDESGFRVSLSWEEGEISGAGDYELTASNATKIRATLFRPHPTDDSITRIASIFDVTLSMQTADGSLFEGSFDGWVIPTDEDEEGSSVTLLGGSFRCTWP